MEKDSGAMIQLDIKIDKLCNGVESLKEKQETMAEDIVKIKEAVYNPDSGIYARIRELESWKATSSKMIWTLFTTMVGITIGIKIQSFTHSI